MQMPPAFTCIKCNPHLTFASKLALEYHQRTLHQAAVVVRLPGRPDVRVQREADGFPCPLCRVVLPNPKGLKRHLNRCQTGKDDDQAAAQDMVPASLEDGERPEPPIPPGPPSWAESVPGLPWPFIVFHRDLGALVCVPCALVILPREAVAHAARAHGWRGPLSLGASRALAEDVLVQDFEDLPDLLRPEYLQRPLPGFKLLSGKLCTKCRPLVVMGTSVAVRKHMANQHKDAPVPVQPCTYQVLFSHVPAGCRLNVPVSGGPMEDVADPDPVHQDAAFLAAVGGGPVSRAGPREMPQWVLTLGWHTLLERVSFEVGMRLFCVRWAWSC